MDSTPLFGLRRDLPRGRHLVTPAWLTRVADDASRLFEVGCGAHDAYAAGHIPGAGYLDTTWFEHGPLWNKVPDATLLQVLLAHGIRHDVTVVLYGRNVLAAARVAHLLLYAGVADVRLLDGGFAAWQRAGLPLEQGSKRPGPAADDFGTTLPARPDYLVDMAQVRTLLRHGQGTLVSIRTWNEYVGKTSGYSYIEARGDIPGALWGRAGEDGDVNSMAAFHHADGRMKPAADIRRMWGASGIHAGRQAVFYCGTGWRASLAFFYAWLMGWDDIAVYDGGWCEWSRDLDNPVVCRTDLTPARGSASASP
ncbi:rhodanese-like domain-containing protein [Telluria mixta]|uniref:Rhodanese-like domain-containing protein n=1 Tax=Telluria mixta TaxID=34071 RepID=A0ABT2BSR8_9BURK|nr:rhodanese-like domain-containing protein [Telluria mixta]MCS0628169.1 rhodanese-like domain-containing protein [Telluria mixta]WEM93715.1 rhodanese-like domain-containing protein [Telluria mixta]